ncbi:putative HTH-type transcriptional regulator [Zhongshania aliphaticivorans]|uniref:Putative HTH-type transcriptional regulator n=1 Tax=Zhongshania aliphaticivorans TaxID=1470434 RepID=A0A5S9QLH2_9GAMM|nr:AraC family transcriptional regulator [Zhongshania aliphaticivorans]CAA0111457.1 putative HTH-type transcriptional regulator [Zhongshania aliphaticivorans]CAA0118640.1 putative HTH-type transcriptional regulator [Zhongshania aliphaticivorans]
MQIVSNVIARLIVRELNLTAESWPQLTKNTRQTSNSIHQQNYMPLSQFNTLLNNALDISGDLALGLKFGRHADALAVGEAGAISLSAPNLHQCLRSLMAFSRLTSDYMLYETVVGDALKIRCREQIYLEPAIRRIQHEVFVLIIQNTVELIIGRPFVEGSYLFAYDKPDYFDQYAEHFNSPCFFNQALSGVNVPHHLGDSPSPFYDLNQWETGRNQFIKLTQEFNAADQKLYSHHVLTILRSHTLPMPTFSSVAQTLTLSERTLSRRLAEEDTTFRKLLNTVTNEWANHYLSETKYSIDAIAAQLGYQDAANFRRAYRQLNNCTPNAYRTQYTDSDNSL